MAVGLAFLVKPVTSLSFLGVDTATASRLSWLAQMTAARDAALGLGTVASALSGRGTSEWLLAGAACDAVDAAAIASALAAKRVAPVPAIGVVVVAASAVVTATTIVLKRRQTCSRS